MSSSYYNHIIKVGFTTPPRNLPQTGNRLTAINAQGQKFDPRLHEALLTAPGEKDLVLEELEKGWMLGDRVIKPTRVKVGNGEPSTPATPAQ